MAHHLPCLEKSQKFDDFLQQSNDLLEKNSRKTQKKLDSFLEKNPENLNSFTFDSLKIQEKMLDYNKKEDFPLQIDEVFTLKEENKQLKLGFIEKEKAYIKEIENITKEILAIKKKYGIMEEKNQVLNKKIS